MNVLTTLSFKSKYYITLGGFVLFVLVAYLKAVQPTLVVYQLCNEKSGQVQRLENAPSRISNLRMALNEYDQSFKKSDENNVYDRFLEELNVFCSKYDITIMKLSSPHNYKTGDFNLNTSKVSLAGNYDNLLNLHYHIDKEFSEVKIVSTSFEVKEEYRTKKQQLINDIYIQYID